MEHRIETWRTVLNALLVLLFSYAAVSKLIVYDEFRRQMLNQVFPAGFNLALFYTLPGLELLTALLLCIPGFNRAGLWLALLLLIGFTGYVGLVLLHAWNRIPCSCGGILGKLEWGPHLVLNCIFLAFTLIIIYTGRKERREPKI